LGWGGCPRGRSNHLMTGAATGSVATHDAEGITMNEGLAPINPNQILDDETRSFYSRALSELNRARVPYLVGGAYAFERYTGIARHTKDLDIFVRETDCQRALAILECGGCRGEITFPHWL